MSLPRWILVLGAATLLACQANDGAFYDAVFPCSIAAATDQCGTSKAGKPMTCYPGSQLGGGSDFCTELCDGAAGAVDAGHVCLASGASLVRCLPVPPPGKTNGCPAGLNCYRTDIGSNEGVCLMMQVCTTDNDCTNSRRAKCAAAIIHELNPIITTDHLECLQPTCATSGSNCVTGEVCSANYYATGGHVPDICIPECVRNQECPPNYACAQNAGAPGAARVCIPGVPGQRCNHEDDCIWGDCVDTGAGFSECIVPLTCTTDLDCSIFNSPTETFACTKQGCVGLTPFNGTACMGDSDCPNGQQCFRYSPYGVSPPKGECRVPCDADGTCPLRGGVLHVCLDAGAGGCYPAAFGLPCTASSECLSELTCTAVSPDPRTIIASATICTTSCATDGDCRNNPLIRGGGFCDADSGLCRLAGQPGSPCDRDAQCLGGPCALDATSGSWQCS
jgi:hypothetical protein